MSRRSRFSSVANNSSRAADFLSNHTDFLSHGDTTAPPNTDCPICLDGIEDHICVKITNIPGCQHLIGLKCLEELLTRDPESKKECPLCRATWIEEDGIWQGSQAWNALASGGRSGGGGDESLYEGWGQMTPPRHGRMPSFGGMPSFGRGHAGSRRRPSYGHDSRSVRASRQPSIPDYAPTSPDPFRMPSDMAAAMHPRGPMFGNTGPMGAFGLQAHDFMAQRGLAEPRYQHGPSRTPSYSHGNSRQPSPSHGTRRPRLDPLHDTEHPPYVGPDGGLMVWVDDDVHEQIEASRRGRQGRGASRSSSRPSYGGQASHRPSYGDWTSRQPHLPNGSFAGHGNRGFQGDRDAFYGPGAQYGGRGHGRDWDPYGRY